MSAFTIPNMKSHYMFFIILFEWYKNIQIISHPYSFVPFPEQWLACVGNKIMLITRIEEVLVS